MCEMEYKELLIYMVTSAAGLPGEPKNYGPLRLIESAQRLAVLLRQAHPEDAALQNLIDVIEAGKGKNMTDFDGFCAMLQEAAAASVDLL